MKTKKPIFKSKKEELWFTYCPKWLMFYIIIELGIILYKTRNRAFFEIKKLRNRLKGRETTEEDK